MKIGADFYTLVNHFFNRFFDKETASEDADPRTSFLQLIVLLTVPGLMMSFFLIPDHALVTDPILKIWARSGDRYMYVCYAMVVMGLVMTYKWDALFPDRGDYQILTSLPISPRRLFAAKVTSLVCLLLLFAVAINLFSIVIAPVTYPGIYIDKLAGHMAGTLGGSLFAALFFAGLQGVLINIMSPPAFRRISSWIQMIGMAVLLTFLLVTPLFKEGMQALSGLQSPVLDYLPTMWFLGLYESFLGNGTLIAASGARGHSAIVALIITGLICATSYVVGYRRYAKKILESVESDSLAPSWWEVKLALLLNRTVLTNPIQRATFHFIGKIAGRSQRHRIMTALYTGAGAALALSSLFAVDYKAAFPFKISLQGALDAPIILSFLMISGLRATFNVPCEPGANWMFQITDGSDSAGYLAAVRKWVFLARILPLYAVIAVFEFWHFTPWAAAAHLTFDLFLTSLLLEVFFLNFNKVPFTCLLPSNKFQLAALAAAYLYGFTIFVTISGQIKRVITQRPGPMIVFIAFMCTILAAIHLLRIHRSKRKARIVYDEVAANSLSIAGDSGYWTSTETLRGYAANRRSRYYDLDDEIRSHIQMAVRDRVALGESESEAQTAVCREFGNIGLIKETIRSVWTWTSVEQILQDFRFGFRILWKSPGLSATAAILIALVIGCNITVYSLVHTLLTKPAPGVHGANLVALQLGTGSDPFPHSYLDYLDYSSGSTTIRPLMAFLGKPFALTLEDGSFAATGSVVTPNYFETLGVAMTAGTGFEGAAGKLGPGGLPVVISYRIWQEWFHGSSATVGKSILMNGFAASIVGIAAQHFQGPYLGGYEDIWVPIEPYFQASGTERQLGDRKATPVAILGRLTPGFALSQAQAEMSTIWKRLPQTVPTATNKAQHVFVSPYSAVQAGGLAQSGPGLLAAFSVVTLLTLLLVCANVANLMLGRAVVRQRETAIRQSFGASRIRILRMLIAEGIAIALVAWIAACICDYWILKGIARILSSAGPNGLGMRFNHFNMDFSPDWVVTGYAMLLAFIGTLAFTLAPAIHSWQRELLPDLKAGEQSIARGPSKLSNALVIAQIAFAVVLLTSGGLIYRSADGIKMDDANFDKNNLLLVTVNPSLAGIGRDESLAVYERIRMRLRSVPGIRDVTYERLPLPYPWGHITVTGSDPQKLQGAILSYVGPDYLRTLGMSPLSGRDFSANEGARISTAAIINKDLADQLWPSQQPVGQMMNVAKMDKPVEIVGVASNIFGTQSGKHPDSVLLSEQQAPSPPIGEASPQGSGQITYYLRYSGTVDAIGPAVGTALREVDSRIPLVYLRTMNTQLGAITAPAIVLMTFLFVFLGGSLFIAVMGQYAVVAFNLKRRTREFGVRMAMGASANQIVTSILREGLVLTVIGLAAGFGLSVAFGRALQSVVYEVRLADFRTYLGVLVVLFTASLVACYIPARRAARIDPLTALRHE